MLQAQHVPHLVRQCDPRLVVREAGDDCDVVRGRRARRNVRVRDFIAPEGSKVGGPAPKAAPVAAPALTAAFAATAPAPVATKARRGMGSGAVNDAQHGPVTTRKAAPAPEAPAYPDLAALVA